MGAGLREHEYTAPVLIGAFASAVLMMAPLLVGGYIDRLGFSPGQAGYLISADMAGMGLATIPAMWWLDRWSWHKVVQASLVLSALLTGLSGFLGQFDALWATRFAAGLCNGTALSVCLAALGLSANPVRGYGLWVVGQLAFGALGLAVMPALLAAWGLQGFYTVMAVILLLPLGVLNGLATGRNKIASQEQRGEGVPLLPVSLAIGGLLAFYIGLSSVWAYIERLGLAIPLSAQSIGNVLFVASLAGIIGALTAAALDKRFGHIIPVSLGVAVMLGAIALLLPASVWAYVAATIVFKFAWTFILPFLLGAINGADPGGRAVVIANIVIGGGLAIGPALAGALVAPGEYTVVVLLGGAAISACFVLSLPLIMRGARRPVV